MAKLNFNPQSAEKREVAGCLPAGDYLASITESGVAPNSKRTGQVLSLTYTCLGEGVKGRKFWQRINIQNQNEQAQRIGQSELREICEAMGLGDRMVDDSALLHNKPVMVKLAIEKDETGRYDDKNIVRRVMPVNGVSGAPAGQPGGFRAPVATQTSAAPFRAPVATPAASPAPFQQQAQQPSPDAAAPSAAPAQPETTAQQQEAAPAQQAEQPQQSQQQPPSTTPAPTGGMPAWMKRATA